MIRSIFTKGNLRRGRQGSELERKPWRRGAVTRQEVSQVVLQDKRVEGLAGYKPVIRAVWLDNVGGPGEQVELEGVQAEGCPSWAEPGLQERVHTCSAFHLKLCRCGQARDREVISEVGLR